MLLSKCLFLSLLCFLTLIGRSISPRSPSYPNGWILEEANTAQRGTGGFPDGTSYPMSRIAGHFIRVPGTRKIMLGGGRVNYDGSYVTGNFWFFHLDSRVWKQAASLTKSGSCNQGSYKDPYAMAWLVSTVGIGPGLIAAYQGFAPTHSDTFNLKLLRITEDPLTQASSIDCFEAIWAYYPGPFAGVALWASKERFSVSVEEDMSYFVFRWGGVTGISTISTAPYDNVVRYPLDSLNDASLVPVSSNAPKPNAISEGFAGDASWHDYRGTNHFLYSYLRKHGIFRIDVSDPLLAHSSYYPCENVMSSLTEIDPDHQSAQYDTVPPHFGNRWWLGQVGQLDPESPYVFFFGGLDGDSSSVGYKQDFWILDMTALDRLGEEEVAPWIFYELTPNDGQAPFLMGDGTVYELASMTPGQRRDAKIVALPDVSDSGLLHAFVYGGAIRPNDECKGDLWHVELNLTQGLSYCYGLSGFGDSGVCGGHGTCVRANLCSCFDGYVGLNCSGLDCSAVNNCSGSGSCVGPQTCSCYDGFGLGPLGDCSSMISGSSNPALAVLYTFIILAVVGGLIAIAVIVFILWFRYRRQKQEGGSDYSAELQEMHDYLLDPNSVTIRRDQPLGRGGQGAVYRGSLKVGMQDFEVAVKRTLFEGSKEAAEREVKLLRGMRHRNIITTYGCYIRKEEPDVLHVVMEFCPNGTVAEWIQRTELDLFEFLGVLQQCADGVAFLHSREIVHRDLKPDNVLVSGDGTLKIVDFGMSKRKQNVSNTILGTPGFIAPEVLRGQQRDESQKSKMDAFSFGVLARQLWGEWTTTEMGIPPDLNALLEDCCRKNPEERPRMKIVRNRLGELRHPQRNLPTPPIQQTHSSVKEEFLTDEVY